MAGSRELLLLAILAAAVLCRPQTDPSNYDWHRISLINPEHRAIDTPLPEISEKPDDTAEEASGDPAEVQAPASSSEFHVHPTSGAENRRGRIDGTSSPPTSTSTSSTGTPSSTSTSSIAQPLLADNPTSIAQSSHPRVDKKAAPIIGDSIKKLANQLLTSNSTDKTRKKMDQSEQKAHAGVAVPMTMEELEKELGNRGHMTTSSGLSTWVLLSGVHSTTTPSPLDRYPGSSTPIKKIRSTPSPYAKPAGRPVVTMVNRKEQVTPKPGNTTTRIMVHSSPLLTKIKASVLADSLLNKTLERTTTYIQSSTTVPKLVTKRTTTIPSTTTTTTTEKTEEATNLPELTTFSSVESKEGAFDLSESREATTKKPKRGSTAQTNANKRKKPNKNRRRPAVANDKTADVETKTKNSTKTALAKKPISTQIYNYLSREVMPTVGVGLVGLVVTAGLTYFLYPFGALRRSYNVDRKDDLYYYGSDELANADGQSEEEVFGKVIAGMPASQLYGSGVSQPNTNQPAYNRQPVYSRHNMPPQQKRPVYRNLPNQAYARQGYVYPENIGYNTHASVQNVRPQQRDGDDLEIDAKPSEAVSSQESFEPLIETTTAKSMEASSTTSGISKQFVVGNVPRELLEPSIVPEHGPRRRRDTDHIMDNEIVPATTSLYDVEENSVDTGESMDTTVKPKDIVNIIEHRELPSNETLAPQIVTEANLTEETTVNATQNHGGRVDSTTETYPNGSTTNLVDFIKRLINFKLRLGLGLLQRTTDALSRYLHGGTPDREMSTPRLS